MDVRNTDMEAICHVFKRYVEYMGVEQTVSFSRVDIQRQQVKTVSTNYSWHLAYWGDELYKKLHSRLKPGINLWNSQGVQNFQESSQASHNRVDIVTNQGSLFEILSISLPITPLPCDVVSQAIAFRPKVNHLALECWSDKEIQIPIDILSTPNTSQCGYVEQAEYIFGNLALTHDELTSVRYFLEMKTFKEVSIIRGCKEAEEARRIYIIKCKLDCQHQPDSVFFKKLVEHGVTVACLDSFITYR
ncbi:hypothetical protein [Vibrio sp. VPAP30]|uniref:hypothetical protein n=1 Tax=Vibrio sp. VPAP30 TaxID=1647102 RepID=UPI00065A14A1|nr:hypothetical protein [Vibrio sp. VPAP30]KLN66296.1 hypothetical protein ZX61_05315 [Vibrio sp. VPAP30]